MKARDAAIRVLNLLSDESEGAEREERIRDIMAAITRLPFVKSRSKATIEAYITQAKRVIVRMHGTDLYAGTTKKNARELNEIRKGNLWYSYDSSDDRVLYLSGVP